MPVIGELGFSLLVFLLWLFCLIDVIATDEYRMRNLPKMGWLLIVLIIPLVGSIAWLVAGRPQPERRYSTAANTRYPEYDRPGRHIPLNPDDDEEFLRKCRERAEAQRAKAREQRRAAEEG